MWWLKTSRQHNNVHWYQERRERTSNIFTRDSRKTRTFFLEVKYKMRWSYTVVAYMSLFCLLQSFIVTERSSANVEKYENDIFQSSVLVYSWYARLKNIVFVLNNFLFEGSHFYFVFLFWFPTRALGSK